MTVFAILSAQTAWGQDSPPAEAEKNANDSTAFIVGHPFSAVKYARRIRVLPNGEQKFIRNGRYPTLIARDADGRLMMQVFHTDDLNPECDRIDLLVPPPCPAWGAFAIDPLTHTGCHWVAGEIGHHGAIDFPLSQADLERAADVTGELPNLTPDFTVQDGKVSTADLGEKP